MSMQCHFSRALLSVIVYMTFAWRTVASLKWAALAEHARLRYLPLIA